MEPDKRIKELELQLKQTQVQLANEQVARLQAQTMVAQYSKLQLQGELATLTESNKKPEKKESGLEDKADVEIKT